MVEVEQGETFAAVMDHSLSYYTCVCVAIRCIPDTLTADSIIRVLPSSFLTHRKCNHSTLVQCRAWVHTRENRSNWSKSNCKGSLQFDTRNPLFAGQVRLEFIMYSRWWGHYAYTLLYFLKDECDIPLSDPATSCCTCTKGGSMLEASCHKSQAGV